MGTRPHLELIPNSKVLLAFRCPVFQCLPSPPRSLSSPPRRDRGLLLSLLLPREDHPVSTPQWVIGFGYVTCLPRFWSLLFPSAGLLKSHREVWRTGRELLAQDPSMLRTLTFPSPQGWGRGCRAALWCLPRPSQQQATPQLVSFPFPAVSLAFLCPGQLVGSFPFPAEADKVFGVLAPLSRAERRAVCKLGSSELPGAPCLPPASLL